MSNNVAAYYRLGDPPGSYGVLDSSGNGQTGSLIGGTGNFPAYGSAGAFLYDVNTSLDCGGGAGTPGSGFQMVDQSTEPPTIHNPLYNSGSVWAVEAWVKYAGGTTYLPNPAASVANAVLFHANCHSTLGSSVMEIQLGAQLVNSGSGTGNSALGIVIKVQQGGVPNGEQLLSPPGSQIFDGNWHHIVYNNGGSDSGVYVDGTFGYDEHGVVNLASSSVTSITFGSPPTGVQGINPNGSGSGGVNAGGFAGYLQDVVVYSSNLTASQILNHYNIATWFKQQEFGASVGGVNAGRLNKLLSVVGLDPTQMLHVPYPFRTTMYSETNQLTTTSALNYLQTMTETEPGLIYQMTDGHLMALSRQFQYLNPTSTTSQATFADSSAASVLHYDGPSFQLVQDDLDVWTDIQVQSGRSGALNTIGAPIGGQSGAILQTWGPDQSATMAAAASVYGSRTLQGLTSLQMQYDSDAIAIAQQYAGWFYKPQRRVTTMMIDSYGAQGAQIPQILERQLYDRITIGYTGQTPGAPFSADFLIEQITHQINMENGPIWTTVYATSIYEILYNAMIFNNWTFGTAASVSVMTL